MANEEHLKKLKEGVEAWNAWREENPEVKPDLIRANLSGAHLHVANLSAANLIRANLSDVNLIRANLNDAKLSGATLIRANLNDAKLNRANLTGANLNDAKLSNADLRHAKLSNADLRHANLSNANFEKSRMGYTVLGKVDLSEAKGLTLVDHLLPSTLGVDTLYASKGKIPAVFLRGCGVPEEFLDYTRGLFRKAIDFYSCFISYSHEDKSFAQRLHNDLQARGIRCWLDEHQVRVGDDIYEAVDRGIRIWDKVVLCASQNSLHSWWVDDEIAKALDKEQRLFKKHGEMVRAIVPLNLDGHLLSDEYSGTHKATLTRRRAADFDGWESDNAKFEEQFEGVVKALRTDREEPPEPKL